MLPEKINRLDVAIGGRSGAGQLLKTSNYEFRYVDADAQQPAVALLMPASTQLTWAGSELFPPMDQNLPEGDLFMRIRAMFPKQQTTAMHMLALIGDNGIGRLGYRLPGVDATPGSVPITKSALLATRYTPQVFDELVRAYLSTGAGIAGVQPKIMVPEVRAAIAIPTLIVKAGSAAYPGLAANEYLCLRAANLAGIETSAFDLSHDGQLLVLERFDTLVAGSGGIERLGFEDIAALAGLRVRDTLSDRKYQGSYQRIAELLKTLQLQQPDLTRFFEQVAFSIMVRNGDAHLKNFGVLYRSWSEKWLAPLFDVVTTSIYRYTQYAGGPELEDRTLALKLFAGKGQTKAYPTTGELLAFGEKVCGVRDPRAVLRRIADGMGRALAEAETDDRIAPELLASMRDVWMMGVAYGG
jgi:serine/threonine-protein kinase HipA